MPSLLHFAPLLLFFLSLLSDQALSQDPFDPVIEYIEAFPISDGYLIVGNATGIVFSYQKGSKIEFTTTVELMSSSKWVAGATIMKLVEQGLLSLDDHVHKHLPFWTQDPTDLRSQITLQHLLSFTSGYESQSQDPDCINRDMELFECAEICYNEGNFSFVPGETFQYGSIHLQFAGAIAEQVTGKRYIELFTELILNPLGMKETYFYPRSGNNPALAYGLLSSTNDYHKFLRSYFLDDLLRTDVRKLMELDYTPNREARLLAGYHYSLTNWYECDNLFVWKEECLEANVHGSLGFYGFYPLVDRRLGYYFVWGADLGFKGSTLSGFFKRDLKPLLDQIMAP